MRYVTTSCAGNMTGDAFVEQLRRHQELGDTPVEIVAHARAGGIRWLTLQVEDEHVQAVVDALTYDNFETPVPAGQVTLDEHNAAVHGTADSAIDAIDGASLGAFLGV